MKKLLFIIFLIAFKSFAQLPPANFPDGIKTKYLTIPPQTEAQRDALTFGALDRVLVYNLTNPAWNFWDGDSWELFGAGVTDHTLLTNIGTNTHAQIDAHIANGNVHYTMAAISITESQISDLNHTVDTTLDQAGIEALGFVTGAHTTDTDDQTGAEVLLTGYVKPGTTSAITATDNINEAIGKLEKGLEDATSGGVTSVAGKTGVVILEEADITDLNHTVDTTLDQAGIEAFGFVTGAHTTDTNLTDEEVQDKVGAMVAAANDGLAYSDPLGVIAVDNTEIFITEAQVTDLSHTVDTDDQTAAEVPNTPSGNLTSTNVQAALNELQTDIDGISGGSTNLSHSFTTESVTIISSTGSNTEVLEATAGSAGVLSAARFLDIVTNNSKVSFPGFTDLLTDYSFTDNSTNWNIAYGWGDHSLAGYSTGAHTTDTNLTDEEVQDKVGAMVAAANDGLVYSDALAVLEVQESDFNTSEIPNTPSGNLVATNVQAALNELQTEIDGISGGGLNNVVEDITPQLGGALDVNGQEIISNGDVSIQIDDDNNTSGVAEFNVFRDGGATSLFKVNELGLTTIPTLSNGAHQSPGNYQATIDGRYLAFVDTQYIVDLDADNNSTSEYFLIKRNNSAVGTQDVFKVVEDGTITAPQTTNALITTAGNKALITKEYADANYSGGGGLSNIVEDTTPQLGGDLDTQGRVIKNLQNFNLGMLSNAGFQIDIDADDNAGIWGFLVRTDGSVNMLEVKEDGTALLSNTEIADITAGGAKSIITKEYADANYSGGGGSVEFASVAEINAGTNNTKAVSPLGLAGSDLVSAASTAVSWGDHSAAGYMSLAGAESVTGAKTFNDGIRLKFGTSGGEAEIFSNGSETQFKLFNGGLNIYTSTGTQLLNINSTGNIVAGSGDFVDTNGTTSTTGTALDISNNITGTLYNIATPSSATTFTTVNPKTGGYAITHINTTSEPVVTGATKRAGAAWESGMNMKLVVGSDDGVNTYYFFLKL